MNKIKFSPFSIIIGLLLCIAPTVQAQVTIGSGTEPNVWALLDLKEAITTTKGLGMPRVSMTTTTPALGVLAESIGATSGTNPWNEAAHIGLTVYNISEALCDTNPIAKGIYVWDGSVWQSILPMPTCDPTNLPLGTGGTFTGRTLFDIAVTDNTAVGSETRGTKAQRASEYLILALLNPQYQTSYLRSIFPLFVSYSSYFCCIFVVIIKKQGLMLIFNTTFHLDDDIHDACIQYLKSEYIPQALASTFLHTPRLALIHAQHEEGGTSYSLQLLVKNKEVLDYWHQNTGQGLEEEMKRLFGNKVLGFVTLLEEIEL